MELSDVKGVKTKRLEALNGAGIYTPYDLLTFFPIKYVDCNKINPDDYGEGEEIAVQGKFTSVKSAYARTGLYVTRAGFLTDKGKKYDVIWYNLKYISSRINFTDTYVLYGRVKKSKTEVLYVPLFIDDKKFKTKIIPVYRTVKGFPSSLLQTTIDLFLDEIEITGFIPENIEQKYELLSLNDAIKFIHRPASFGLLNKALNSVKMNFLCCYFSLISLDKEKFSKKRGFFYRENRGVLQEVIKSLPFKLTADQLNAVDEIIGDMQSDRRLNRLLMGDVGSGKTIVAFLAMYYAVLSGYQCAIMAPTELLASQHYTRAMDFFTTKGVGVAIVVGSQTAKQRQDNLFKISSGSAQVVVGTHALFSDDVEFRNLSLIVIDEQHRFGVSQRAALENKTTKADILVMSATPIPRTIALTLYGDLTKTEIRAKPGNKLPVKTKFVPESKKDDMINYLIADAEMGNQTFIVCPRIEDEENYGAENFYKELKKKYADCACLHGKLKENVKQAVMNDFVSGKIKILVSTTVIEVGIDVSAAVNMVIFDADRFGLSQLHQLRGRVGRGGTGGFCFVLTNNAAAYENRLKFFCGCSDGFELAEEDFRLRGAGDFFGTKQHGVSEIGIIAERDIILAKRISDDILDIPGMDKEIAADFGDKRNYIKSITLN